MPYPREIYLGEVREAELVQHIESELVQYYMDTSEHLDDLIQWQSDYWAKPTKKQAIFPFKGACTTVIPVTAIAVEAIHARTETQLFGQQQLVAAQSISNERDEAQKPLEDFMNYYLFRKIEINGEEKNFSVVYKDGPCFDAIPDSRFLYPYWAKDVQSSDWVGEEHSESPYYIYQAEKAGLFREGIYEDLMIYMENQMSGSPGDDGKKFDRSQMDLEHTKYSIGKNLEWIEFWTAWEVDSSDIKKEIVIHYHRDSRKIMSIRYNYLSDLRRPYRIGKYFPVEHRSRGIGICKMNEQFQRSITTRHRQFVDNATLANIRMFKIHKLSGYGNGEPIFPGKMWFLDNMDQIDTIQMGEVILLLIQ